MPEFLTCMHEESAVGMAHGYFKVAGKPLMTLCHGTVGLQHATMAHLQRLVRPRAGDRRRRQRPRRRAIGRRACRPSTRRRTSTRWCATSPSGTTRRSSLQHFAQSFVRAYKIAMTPPYGPVAISLDAGLQQEPIKNNGEKLYIPRYVPTRAAAGRYRRA